MLTKISRQPALWSVEVRMGLAGTVSWLGLYLDSASYKLCETGQINSPYLK